MHDFYLAGNKSINNLLLPRAAISQIPIKCKQGAIFRANYTHSLVVVVIIFNIYCNFTNKLKYYISLMPILEQYALAVTILMKLLLSQKPRSFHQQTFKVTF